MAVRPVNAFRAKYDAIASAVSKRVDLPSELFGEDDPKLIRAAFAIAMLRDERIASPEDLEAARAVFATIGMLRC